MELIKNYRDNAVLRQSFDALARETFGLSFEDWYQNGYWQDAYNPYSIVDAGRVVANVSVNRTDFICHGTRRRLIQLGTVMTVKEYRNRGLIRRLMEQIEKEYAAEAEGMYLFANDSVLDFYPKFGFRKAQIYQYTREIHTEQSARARQISMQTRENRSVLEEAIRRSVPQGAFDQTDNVGLTMFYVTKFMQNAVYYDPVLDAYAIAEAEDGRLLLYNVFADRPVAIEEIAAAFGGNIRCVEPGFMPETAAGYTVAERKEKDTTLFVKGNGWDVFEQERAMIPLLSYA